jgi:hypothetical protein
MEAPRLTAKLAVVASQVLAVTIAACCCTTVAQAASARTQNFIVSAATPALAKELCAAAEEQRRDLAIEWLGQELPPWQQPCPIECKIHPQLGAGGATQFSFNRSGVPFGWTMSVQGSRERVLDSVLPHEITHTIFASHFGRPLPRWADEGACTTVEHTSEKSKQERFLIEFLMTERGIPFNKMFAMKEYPPDMLPLYAQGYSLARYLIMQGGKQKFVQYVGEGMQTDNWPAATRKYYGHKDLSDLQVTWLGWVKSGSPKMQPIERELGRDEMMIAANEKAAQEGQSTSIVASPVTHSMPNVAPSPVPAHALMAKNKTAAATTPTKFNNGANNANTVSPPRPEFNVAANTAPPTASNVARPYSEGWYARKRDEVRQQVNNPAEMIANERAVPPPEPTAVTTPISTPVTSPAAGNSESSASPPLNRRVMLEWSRPLDQPWSPGQTIVENPNRNPARTNEQLTRRDLAADGGRTAIR